MLKHTNPWVERNQTWKQTANQSNFGGLPKESARF